MINVLIIGSGFAGLGMAIALKRAGIESFTLLERAADLGGTWRDNQYPGCACDIPSLLYSFSFAPNPGWSRTYPAQAEIWSYLRACAHKFGVEPHIQFDAEVREARYDAPSATWHVRTADGQTIQTRVLICGMGGLSNPLVPEIAGLAAFTGKMFHSARWDHDFDLAGKRVGVIGTGASAIQFVPRIASVAAELTIFQRTPPWIIPRRDRATSPAQRALRRLIPGYAWLQRQVIYWILEVRALGFTVNTRLLAAQEAPALKHLEAQVTDPALRATLTPDYSMGCKRVLLSDDYYPALRRPNVHLVSDPISEVRARSLVTKSGREYEVDAIILGTGFRAQDFIAPVKIYGSDGFDLDEAWRDGPRSYLGINVAGFPNLYFLVGPNTGLGHNSMIVMIESQIRYVMSALKQMRKHGIHSLEVEPQVEKRFSAGLQRRTKRTVWASGCKSWYLDAHGRNTTLWPGFTFAYRFLTRKIDLARYRVGRSGYVDSSTRVC